MSEKDDNAPDGYIFADTQFAASDTAIYCEVCGGYVVAIHTQIGKDFEPSMMVTMCGHQRLLRHASPLFTWTPDFPAVVLPEVPHGK